MTRPYICVLGFVILLTGGALTLEARDWQAAEPPAPSQMSSKELETKADAFRLQKEWNSALDYYNLAIKKDSKNAILVNKAGMTELQLGLYDQARRRFERAVKLDKKYAEAINNIGVAYYLRKDYRRAITQYRKALALRDEASFHTNLGAAYFDNKELKPAMAEYMRALQLDPEVFERTSLTGISAHVSKPQDRAEYAFMMARLYARFGDVDHAITQLKRARENGYPKLDDVYRDDEFAAVRQDPRFAELMGSETSAIPE
ncbi:MAG TPA: tetratricopeptide repeat protein [Clostridia bacterium]|nr:tetratricopeptide repeat protein [Clostridia bacterium]